MRDLDAQHDQIAIYAKLIVFAMVPTVAASALHVTYIGLGLSFIVASLLQALITPRRKGLVLILTVSIIFTVAACGWRWLAPIS